MTHVKGRRVFLSGPMTGLPDWNRAAFEEAEEQLVTCGIPLGNIYNPGKIAESMSRLSHDEALLRSIHAFSTVLSNHKPLYDLLVSLPGWEKSAGARLEREVAEACGIEVCNLDEVVE